MSLAISYDLNELQKFVDKILDPTSRTSSVDRRGSIDGTFVESVKMQEQRKIKAREIYETEKTYVNSLRLVTQEFLIPLREKAILTKEQIIQIFNYWEVIMNCHITFLAAITDRMKSWDSKPEIGDIFLEKTAFIKVYKHYVNNYDNVLDTLEKLTLKVPSFKEHLMKVEYTNKMNNLGLNSFLIMPIQRIPRYVLLLQDLLKSTLPQHADYENIKNALTEMKDLADYINNRKRDTDEFNKILSIQKRIIGWPANQSLAKEQRKLIREGYLYFNREKVKVFLFSDAFLYCKPKGKDQLKYKGLIPLPTSIINYKNLPTNVKGHFEIISPVGKILFTAENEEKDSWIRNLEDGIDQAQKALLSTAFSGHEQKDSEGSKQFQKLREEENLRKRSEMAVRILNSEKLYVENLKNIVQIFIEPFQAAAVGNYPIIPSEDIQSIFYNIDQIYKAHLPFVDSLQKRVDTFEVNSTTLGDLFYEHDVNILKLYNLYIENHPSAVETLYENMTSELNFAAFVVQAEKDHKINLESILDLPIKKISSYYLEFQELHQYTPDTHPDYNKLKLVVARLKEQTQDQTQRISTDKTKTIGRAVTPILKRTGSARGKNKFISGTKETPFPTLSKRPSSVF